MNTAHQIAHDLSARFTLFSAANWLADRLWGVADALGRASVAADVAGDTLRRWGIRRMGVPRG